jgi:hypothetical protein
MQFSKNEPLRRNSVRTIKSGSDIFWIPAPNILFPKPGLIGYVCSSISCGKKTDPVPQPQVAAFPLFLRRIMMPYQEEHVFYSLWVGHKKLWLHRRIISRINTL